MSPTRMLNYLDLLKIRQLGVKRNTIILGGVFIIAFVLFIALGMLDRLSGRSLYLTSALIVIFGFGFLFTRVKLEIIKGSIELINNLAD
jgi:hypothetical protein